MSLPAFFPPTRYVPSLDTTGTVELWQLCEAAGVPCRASGAWRGRLVAVRKGTALAVRALPGPQGAVEVTLPSRLSEKKAAQLALGVMAYVFFDGVARASIKGAAWRRISMPQGRHEHGASLEQR